MAARVPPTVDPAKEMSPPEKPVTGSLNTTVKRTGGVWAGSVWPAAWLIVTLGGASTVTAAELFAR